MAKAYRLRPSKLMGVEDSYTAYCFDEACFYFEVCLASGKTPVYESKAHSFSEFYDRLLR